MGLFSLSNNDSAMYALRNLHARLHADAGMTGKAILQPATPEELAAECFSATRILLSRSIDAEARLAESRKQLDAALARIAELEKELERVRASLRDEMAGKAMPLLAATALRPMIEGSSTGEDWRAAVAQEAYRMADAMLAERAAKQEVQS